MTDDMTDAHTPWTSDDAANAFEDGRREGAAQERARIRAEVERKSRFFSPEHNVDGDAHWAFLRGAAFAHQELLAFIDGSDHA